MVHRLTRRNNPSAPNECMQCMYWLSQHRYSCMYTSRGQNYVLNVYSFHCSELTSGLLKGDNCKGVVLFVSHLSFSMRVSKEYGTVTRIVPLNLHEGNVDPSHVHITCVYTYRCYIQYATGFKRLLNCGTPKFWLRPQDKQQQPYFQ